MIGLLQGLWHAIITRPSLKLLMDSLLLPQAMEVLQLLFCSTLQQVIDGAVVRVGQPIVECSFNFVNMCYIC